MMKTVLRPLPSSRRPAAGRIATAETANTPTTSPAHASPPPSTEAYTGTTGSSIWKLKKMNRLATVMSRKSRVKMGSLVTLSSCSVTSPPRHGFQPVVVSCPCVSRHVCPSSVQCTCPVGGSTPGQHTQCMSPGIDSAARRGRIVALATVVNTTVSRGRADPFAVVVRTGCAG